MNLFIFLGFCWGVVSLICYSKIMEKVRKFPEQIPLLNKIKISKNGENINFLTYILSCSTCLGFWTGLIISLCFPDIRIYNPIVDGLISSGIIRLIDK